jgi:hypothetical protein
MRPKMARKKNSFCLFHMQYIFFAFEITALIWNKNYTVFNQTLDLFLIQIFSKIERWKYVYITYEIVGL